MKTKNKKNKAIIFICLAAAAYAGYFYIVKPKYNKTAANNSLMNGNKAAIPVTTITITKQKVQLYVDLPGRVNAKKIAQVRPQIDGVIRAIKFTEGALVKQGQTLYQIDSEIYQAAAKGNEANVKALTAKRNRYKILLEQDAVSKQEFDDIQAALDQAKSEAAKAKKNLDYTKVLAPISGFIGKTNYTEGALVTANQTNELTTIVQLDPIYVDLEQPAQEVIAGGNRKEIPVSLIADDPSNRLIGKLKFSEMFVDESTDSIRLRAEFSNKDHKLLPGMFVSAKLHLSPFQAVTVPQRVTNRTMDGKLMVWVVQSDNTVKARTIKAEKIFNDSWIVQEGLEEGEVVVYEGVQKISEGAKVVATPAQIEEAKPAENKSEVKK